VRAVPPLLRSPAPCLASLVLASGALAQTPSSDRAADDLLARADLQAIVDLQTARDGDALAERLGDSDPTVRARAAFALASVQDPAAVPALVGALADPDPRVRADAAFALGQSADSSRAPELLVGLARETDPVVRRRLFEALGKTGDRASLVRLARLEAAGEEVELAMAIARYGLRDVHDAAAVARLAALLANDDSAVREAAAYPLGRWRDPAPWAGIAGPAVREALDAAYPFQAGGRGTVAPAGPAPEIHLVPALGRLGDPGDTTRLVRWLEDGVDWRARVAAARALGIRATADDSVAEALVAAFEDPSVHVGVAAAAALAEAESLPAGVVHRIATWVTTRRDDWRVGAEALPVLARSGAESFVILYLMWLDAQEPGNVFARAKALRALGEGIAPAGFLVLEDQAGWDDPRVAAAALAGLAERWRRGVVGEPATTERYFAAFARALERGDVATVSEAAPALADSAFGAMGAVERLIRAYRAMVLPRDLEAMAAVLGALGETADPAARALLEETLQSPELALRRAAAAALEAMTGAAVAVPAVAEPPGHAVDWSALAALGARPRLVLETERGRIAVALDAEQAPLTVQTIAELAAQGRYDGVPFHRVVPNFVVQGGDFARGDGYGGPGFEIVSEFTRIPYRRGVIGMASAGKDTEGSQYFLTHAIQPHLDGRYTAFGTLLEGGDVLDAIVEGDRVTSARVEPGPVP
jgi:cyclophilin family peptidyl-prolyl cis-trans isomerase